MLEIDWNSLTDQQLSALINNARSEHYRRQSIAGAVDAVPEIRDAILTAEGQESGGPFVPPTGAHNAYPKDWIVTHDGKEWKATREGAHGVPGESGDWRQVAEEGEILDWVAPTGAHNAYEPGALVVHNGNVWRNDHTEANAWEPGTPGSQWTDLGPVENPEEPEDHEENEDHEDHVENEILEWVQPTGAHNTYGPDSLVVHNGHVWRNEHEANGWEPGTPHSQWTDLGPVEEYEEEV